MREGSVPAAGARSDLDRTLEIDDRWAALIRTAAAVRQSAEPRGRPHPPRRRWRRRRAQVLLAGTALAAALSAWLLGGTLRGAADTTADSDLFALVNQDRASNGLASLQYQSTLAAIAENKPYGGCGFTVIGRSYDMIQRNYFSHVILNCDTQYVFAMMQADGVNYRSAGENIGWSSNSGGAAASASYINTAFMNSPEHRANILNANYTHLGVGSDGPVASWSGAGSTYSNVWMFSEEFAQLSAPAPPPPPPPPPPTNPPPPTAPPATPIPAPATNPPRNEPAPTPSLPAPASTESPSTPTASPSPSPTTAPTEALTPLPQPPLVWMSQGLLIDSVESVLEGFLLD